MTSALWNLQRNQTVDPNSAPDCPFASWTLPLEQHFNVLADNLFEGEAWENWIDVYGDSPPSPALSAKSCFEAPPAGAGIK